MVIAKLSDGSIILGLARENIDRLTKGQPVRVTNATHPGSALPDELPMIAIMFGETTADIIKELEAAESATHQGRMQ